MSTPERSVTADALVSEIHIAVPAERVFEALTDPQQVPKWWGQIGVYRCTKFHSDLRVDGRWQSIGIDGRGNPFEISGRYLEIARPRLLATTWRASWTGVFETMVRWELEEEGEGTRVRVTHSGLGAHPEIAKAYQGWPRMLGWLQAFVERSEEVDQRKPLT